MARPGGPGANAELHDPADQLIVATAQHRGARLVTSDERIAATGTVTVVD